MTSTSTKVKQLLIVAHTPSPNTVKMSQRLHEGALTPDANNVHTTLVAPLSATPSQVLNADAIILYTPENLGYMSGAMKDFFDRIYYPCLEKKQGLPYALCVRAGHDGTGTCRAVTTITTGLRWQLAQPHLVCKGPFQDEFLSQCHELGTYMAIALDSGIL
ncbi:MAG: flavodoxin [Moraxellaceae bacterium]|nr:MAG: flavodoxin [Moraxellaceae bacterium]